MIRYGKTVICDKCGKEYFMDYPDGINNLTQSQELPAGWIRLRVEFTDTHEGFTDILCPSCKDDLLGGYLIEKHKERVR